MLGASLGVAVDAEAVGVLLGVFGSVATDPLSSPLQAASTGSPRPTVATPASVLRSRWGGTLGRALMAATVRIDGGPPHCPGVLGPDSQKTHSASPQADLRVAFFAAGAFLAAALRAGAFVAAALVAGALRARLATFGCFASRPSSSGARNWPV